MVEDFIPVGAVATIFFFIWIAAYPHTLMDELLFRRKVGATDFLVSVGTWVFLVVTVLTMVYFFGP
jgi:hypothetical protein